MKTRLEKLLEKALEAINAKDFERARKIIEFTIEAITPKPEKKNGSR